MKILSPFFINLIRLKWYIWILFSIFFCIIVITAIQNFHEEKILLAAGYSLLIHFFIFFTYARYYEKIAPVPKKLMVNVKLQKAKLNISDILMKEFDYVHDTASQAMNDRHTVVNYFLIITGGTITLFGAFLKPKDYPDLPIKNILFTTLMAFNFIGWIYYLKIIRLRQAWMESARAMNHIKKFYLQNLKLNEESCKKIFRWRVDSQPAANKPSNVFYYSAVLISFFTSIALLVGWLTAMEKSLINKNHQWYIYFVGIYHFIFQILMYSEFLREVNKEND